MIIHVRFTASKNIIENRSYEKIMNGSYKIVHVRVGVTMRAVTTTSLITERIKHYTRHDTPLLSISLQSALRHPLSLWRFFS